MPRERQLAAGGEDAYVGVGLRAIVGRQEEHRLGEVHLPGYLPHQLGRQPAPVGEDAKLVALQRGAGEHVRDQELAGDLPAVVWLACPQLDLRNSHGCEPSERARDAREPIRDALALPGARRPRERAYVRSAGWPRQFTARPL